MSDTRSVTLAYPYTDAEGTTHQPDETIDVPVFEARNLLADGLARLPSEGDDEPTEPEAPELVTVTLAYPHEDYAADETVELPAEVAAGLLSDGLARLPQNDAEAPAEDPGGNQPTTIPEILAAVGDDKTKAQQYLDAENAATSPRSSLIEKLQAVLDATDGS